LTSADGSVYNGYFVNGKKNGEGLLLYANGDKYDGFFLDDIFEGEGILTLANGIEKKGTWKNGALL
jgi:hypothetical protein